MEAGSSDPARTDVEARVFRPVENRRGGRVFRPGENRQLNG
jgi:hypothetical protein